MSQSETLQPEGQGPQDVVSINEPSPLDQLLHEGARQMLMRAVEAEVAAYIETHQHEVDEKGRRLVVRNGPARQPTLVSGVGPIKIRAPRVVDRRVDEQGRKFRFTSEILPPYLRRTKSVEELIPWLYLKGISTGDFSEALKALLGADAPGLSATTVVRLNEIWRRDYDPPQDQIDHLGRGLVRSLQHDACGPPATGFEAPMVLGSGARGHTTGGGREIREGELLIEADLYDSPASGQPRSQEATDANRSLYRHVQRLGLDVETIVPIHGQPTPWSDLAALVDR